MRWGVEYLTPLASSVGLIIFTAEDLRAANEYVDRMCLDYGFSHVANLREIKDGCTLGELRRLFPGYLPERVFPKQFKKQDRLFS